jgi:hypothetical protein
MERGFFTTGLVFPPIHIPEPRVYTCVNIHNGLHGPCREAALSTSIYS